MFVNAIVSGYAKVLTNQNEELKDKRLKICISCELVSEHPVFGYICSKNKSTKEGKVGCGCVLAAKTRLENGECPLNKW